MKTLHPSVVAPSLSVFSPESISNAQYTPDHDMISNGSAMRALTDGWAHTLTRLILYPRPPMRDGIILHVIAGHFCCSTTLYIMLS